MGQMRILGVAVFGLMVAGVAGAQAPAGAPAGSNGICKDGSYSTAASKDGACRGHKGVQTWYAAAPAKAAGGGSAAAMPAPTPATKPAAAMAAPAPAMKPAASMAAPTPATKPAAAMAAPAPTARPSAAGSSAPAKGPAAAAAAKTAAPGGGAGLVWVNTESKVYHCYGTTYYGKTKAGAYMSEADAQAKGAHGERGQSCSK